MARKLFCGVGVNDAGYVVCPKVFKGDKWVNDNLNFCPFYRTWYEMLRRCYSSRILGLRPTYEGCEVQQSWKTFSNFKQWMALQDWKGNVLDKDLLVESNKIYSDCTCLFISAELNSFLTLRDRSRGLYLLGVSKNNTGKPFKSEGYDIEGKKLYLGSYESELEAHLKYLESKLVKAENFAKIETDVNVKLGLDRIIHKLKNHILNRIPLNQL